MQQNLLRWTALLAAWPLSVTASPAKSERGDVLARQAGQCDFRVPAGENESCESLARAWGLSIGEFRQRNPGVECGRLTPGALYCIDWSEGPAIIVPFPPSQPSYQPPPPPPPPPSRSPPPPSRPTTVRPIPTPRPSFPGTTIWVSYTNRPTILPPIQSTRQPPPPPPPPPPPVSTIWMPPPPPPTPTPAPWVPGRDIQPGAVPYCRRYHEVVSGDNCWVVEQRYGISDGDLRAWNTQLNRDCTNMWLGYLICVGV